MPDGTPADSPASAKSHAPAAVSHSPAVGPAAAGLGIAGPGAGPASPPGLGDRASFRLAAFGAVLVVVLFAGYGLGRLNNGVASASAPTAPAGAGMPGMVMDESRPHAHAADGTDQTGATRTATTMPMGAAIGGLSLSSNGLTLVPAQTSFTAGRAQRLSFRITGSGGAPITTYAQVHDKMLHLVVIRRDLDGFQHLHPSMAPDGTWSIDLTLAEPGVYRMIADFTAVVGGQPVATTLGSDLTVAGTFLPRALPPPVRTVKVPAGGGKANGGEATGGEATGGEVGDAAGFVVGYEGTPSTRSTQPILVSVAGAKGAPVVLEPYLGAFGHLVVLRQGDLAYVHVHPEAVLVGGKVKFWLAVPSSGTYRMFFDFQVAGHVHTAAWTAVVS